jgi:RNA polymerase sigma factor (sigma-70 family)
MTTAQPSGLLLDYYHRAPGGEPVTGPYAEKWYDGIASAWRIRLTEKGKQLIADFHARYPHPIALLKKVRGKLYAACRAAGLSDDEIDSACWEGVCRSAVRFDPARAAFVTVAAWGVRAAVGDALRRRVRHVREVPTPFHLDYENGRGHSTEPAAPDPFPHLECALDLAAVVPRVKFTDQEREVFARRFSAERPTLDAVAHELGLTRERIRQLEEHALDRVRLAFGVDTADGERVARMVALTRPRILALLVNGPLTRKDIRARLKTAGRYVVNAIRELAAARQVSLRGHDVYRRDAAGRRRRVRVVRVHLSRPGRGKVAG